MPAPSGSAPAGSRRFWITVLCFAILNVGAWIGYHKLMRPARRDVLAVEQFAPGDRAVVSGRPTITWRFNIDVAPHGAGGPVKAEQSPGTIQPAVAGAWSWADSRTLAFEPAQDLPKATEFKLTLPVDKLVSPDGFVLAQPDVRTLCTAPLALDSVRQVAFDDQDRLILELKFSDGVVPADVVSHLAILGPEAKPIKYTPFGDNTGSTFRLQTDSIAALRTTDHDSSVEVKITPGLTGVSGPLGIESPMEQEVPISHVLLATEVTPTVPGEGDPYLQVRFNNHVDLAKVQQVISVDPALAVTVNEDWRGIVLHGPFQCGTRYAVKIGKGPADVAGYPRAATLSVFVPDREPAAWFKQDAGYLGSQGNRTVQAMAVNVPAVAVRVTRVYDNNLVTWRNSAGEYFYASTFESKARAVVVKRILLANVKNKPQELRLSIDDLLGTQAKDGVYRISLTPEERVDEPLPAEDGDDYADRYSSGNACIVTLSDIGLTAKRTYDGVVVWAASLSTGKPQAHVRVRAYSNKNQLLGEGTTDADGLVKLAPLNPGPGESASVILADLAGAAAGGEATAGLTWLDLRRGDWNLSETDTGGRPYFHKGFEAFVYTDRGVYRPGETVVLRAIVRGFDGATPQPFPVKWQIKRPDGRNWESEVATLDADGAAEWKLVLPGDLNTGYWSAQIGLPGATGSRGVGSVFGQVAFQIEEFMPDRMKMTVALSGEGLAEAPKGDRGRFVVADKPLLADVQADYLFGQPAANLATGLVARMEPTTFASKAYGGWTFGDTGNVAGAFGSARALARRIEVPAEKLDDNGHLQFELDLNKAEGGAAAGATGAAVHPKKGAAATTMPAVAEEAYPFQGPWRIVVTATTSEVGGRSVTATDMVDGDELPYYVGLRNERATPPRPGEACPIKVALVTPKGALADAAEAKPELAATLYKEVWNNSLTYDHGEYHYNSTRVLQEVKTDHAADLSMSGAQGTCAVTPPASGAYVLCVIDKTTKAYASLSLYATEGEGWDDNISRENPERLEIRLVSAAEGSGKATAAEAAQEAKASAEEAPVHFEPGQKVRAIVRSPFAGEMLLTVETDDVLWTKIIDMPKPTTEVEFALPAAARPNAYVTAAVIRPVDPNAQWQTHRAYGATNVLVDHADRKLAVEITAPAQMRPGRTLDLAVRIKDPEGRPVRNAMVTLSAVDEGICRLTAFQTPDPLEFFNGKRALGVRTDDLYANLLPEIAKPDASSVVGGGDSGESAEPAYDPRHRSPVTAKRVRPVALISEVLHTDADGMAQAHLQVPEFLGQLRVMTVAAAGNCFGSADKPVLVKSPVVVQSSWPRFAAPGDKFEVPLLVFNNTPEAGAAVVTVELRDPENGKGANPLHFAESPERKITLPPVNIAAGGQAELHLTVAAGEAVGIAPTHLEATLNGETFSEDVELPVRPASPTVTRGDYVMATVGKAVHLTLPDDLLAGTSQIDIRVTPKPDLYLPDGLEYLDHYPYGCVEQVTSTCFPLVYLNDIGDQIAPGMFDKSRLDDKIEVGVTRLLGMQTTDGGLAMWPGYRESWPWASVYACHFLIEARAAGHDVPDDFLQRLEAYVRMQLDKPLDETDSVETQAYAAYVLALAGKPERAAMNRLGEVITAREKLGKALYGEDQGRFYLAVAWLASGRRDLATGLIPQVLPQPRTGRELTGNIGSPIRDQAIVINTLLAVAPDNPAIPGLVEKLAAAGRAHHWYSTQDNALAIMALGRYLRVTQADAPYDGASLSGADAAAAPLAKADHGRPLLWTLKEGRLASATVELTGQPGAKGYVAWSVSGVPLKAPADADHGVEVRRHYLDDDGKVVAGTVRSGQLVHVEMTVDTKVPLDDLVLEDLLPAGLEVENPRLVTTAGKTGAETPPAAADGTAAFGDSRLDVRDDRLVVIGSAPAGRSRYVYTARAITPGTYVVPPIHAECMYDIGTNSLSGGGTTLKVLAPDEGPPVNPAARVAMK